MRLQVSQEKQEGMIKAQQAGKSLEEAAALFGCGKKAARNAFRRRGLVPKKRGNQIPQIHQEKMIDAYLIGKTLKESALLFGYSAGTVKNALKRRGLTLRKGYRKQVPQEHQEKMIGVYQEGKSLEEAAALFGYTRSTVQNALKRRNLKIRTRQVPQEHQEEMVKAYQEGESLDDAAALFGYTRSTVRNALKRRNLIIRKAGGRQIPLDIQKEIVFEYTKGATLEGVAQKFRCNRKTMVATLIRRGFHPRSIQVARRLYSHDEHFFDKIDTEEKAYWVGFLTADGCLSEPNKISLVLAQKDRGHLCKFLLCLKSTHPIYDRTHYDKRYDRSYSESRIGIRSTNLYESLVRLGVTERKSLIVDLCPEIPPNLEHHYFRGLVDGDGWIVKNKRGTSFTVGLCGSENIVRGFQKYITRNNILFKAKPRPNGKIFVLSFSGVSLPQQVTKLLYYDATIFLDRKKEVADKLLSTPILCAPKTKVFLEKNL